MMMNLCGICILFFSFIVITIGQNADLDSLFEKYYQWRHHVYPHPSMLSNGKMEDFSLPGIKARIRQCVKFNENVDKLKPEDSRYDVYKNAFKGWVIVMSSYKSVFIHQHFQFETSFCKDAEKHQGYLFAPISTVHGGVHTYVRDLGRIKIGDMGQAKMYLKKIKGTTKMLRDIW